MNFSSQFLKEAVEILDRLDTAVIDRAVAILADTRRHKGRLFILGVGGSAANVSHAVNDSGRIAAGCHIRLLPPGLRPLQLPQALTRFTRLAASYVRWRYVILDCNFVLRHWAADFLPARFPAIRFSKARLRATKGGFIADLTEQK